MIPPTSHHDDLAGRVALVTGGARGQGAAHAVMLARLGVDIVLFDVCASLDYPNYPLATPEDMERSAAAVEAEGRRCLPVVGDVRDVAAVQACVRRADQRFGRLDILVNNAGVCGITPFQEITERQWEAMLSINVTGPWNFARAALGPLSASDAGRIINTGSVATLRGLAGMAHYVASKHAVLGLTRTLAIELAPLGITANCISPGTADTELDPGLDAGLPPGEGKVRYAEAHLTGRMVEPQEISRLVAFLASPGSASITGQNFVIDGGWSA